MDISALFSTDYAAVSDDTRVAKVVSAFEDPNCRGVVVTGQDGYEGIITRRELMGSRYDPDRTAGTIARASARMSPDEDVREVARLMIDTDSRMLPVFEEGRLRGIVTADHLIDAVQEHLSAVDVADAYTADIVTVDPATTLGEALNRFREHRITHLPVVRDESAVGMLTLYDIVDLTVRETDTPDGGTKSAFASGSEATTDGARTHGGHGAREGETDRMLDLPVRDQMSRPVRTTRRGATLEDVAGRMSDADASSLVVTDREERPIGIVTKTDVLDALTWGIEGHRAVQVYGTEYLDDVTYEDIVDMVDHLDTISGGLDLMDVRIHINQHQERRRGTPLFHVTARLSTNRGMITATAEGYGASHGLNEVEDILKRRLSEDEAASRSKKHPDREFWDRRFGWLLEE